MSDRDESTNPLNYAAAATPSRLRSPRLLSAVNVVIVLSALLAICSIVSTIYFSDEEVDLTVLSTSLFMVLCILVPVSVFQIVLVSTAGPRTKQGTRLALRRRSVVISGIAIVTIALSTVFVLKPAIIHDVIKLLP